MMNRREFLKGSAAALVASPGRVTLVAEPAVKATWVDYGCPLDFVSWEDELLRLARSRLRVRTIDLSEYFGRKLEEAVSAEVFHDRGHDAPCVEQAAGGRRRDADRQYAESGVVACGEFFDSPLTRLVDRAVVTGLAVSRTYCDGVEGGVEGGEA